jgi:hypothetical protein
MSVIYEYNVTDTLNNKVNDYSLELEAKLSPLEGFLSVTVVGLQFIQMKFEGEIGLESKTILDGIIGSHSGVATQVDEYFVNIREKAIRDMTELAILHPDLNSNDAVEYLTALDNYLNSWKRSGNHSVVVAKITADSQNTSHPQSAFLLSVVNTDGVKTFEYLLDGIINVKY